MEGNIFIQIPGGGTTRLEELMEDISQHYSQVQSHLNCSIICGFLSGCVILFYSNFSQRKLQSSCPIPTRTRCAVPSVLMEPGTER